MDNKEPKICSWRMCEPDLYENGKCTVHECDVTEDKCPQDCLPADHVYINETDAPDDHIPICAEHARQVHQMCTEQVGCEVVRLNKEEWEVYKLVNC